MEERYCPGCETFQSIDNFHKSSSRGYQIYCKLCRKEIDADYYLKNKNKRIKQTDTWYKEFTKWARNLKNAPCTDCGIQYHPVCMQWDHLPEYEKLDSIANIVKSGSKAKVLAEIEKCELVCANCHALRTHYRLMGDSLT